MFNEVERKNQKLKCYKLFAVLEDTKYIIKIIIAKNKKILFNQTDVCTFIGQKKKLNATSSFSHYDKNCYKGKNHDKKCCKICLIIQSRTRS